VEVLLYAGALVAIALFARGLWQRIRLWRGGGPEPRFDRVGERLRLVATEALGQARTLSQAYPGVMHAIMFWGFLALLTGTVLATIDWDITLPLFGMKLLQGPFYLFYEAVLDLFGRFFVIRRGMAGYRRFVVRPHRLDAAARFARALALLLAINVSGFLVEACRLAATRPPWAPWSPVGWALGQGLLAAGLGPGALRSLHLSLWLVHAALALGFIALIPYSYFAHLITTPLNIFFAKLGPRGEIAAIANIEPAEARGVPRLEECPAFIDIVDTIVDLRRYLALSEGALPSTAPQSLHNIQRAGNPWGLPAADRLRWADGLDVPVLAEGREVEYLYWVGCSASYDRRNQAIARAVVKILKAAGVSFAVMQEERCHGEVARRLGEEYLYQTVQRENIGNLKRYRFRKIITHCPHCFNTLKNEFPQFGGRWEVLHHSLVIEGLLWDE